MESIDYITMGNSFHGEGWHESEGPAENEIRWMRSGGSATITIIADQTTAVQVTCGIVSFISKEVFENIQIFIDNDPIEFYLHGRGTGMELEFVIPRRTESSIATVRFQVEKKFSSPSPDQRLLSLAFKNISVHPISFDRISTMLDIEMDVQ